MHKEKTMLLPEHGSFLKRAGSPEGIVQDPPPPRFYHVADESTEQRGMYVKNADLQVGAILGEGGRIICPLEEKKKPLFIPVSGCGTVAAFST